MDKILKEKIINNITSEFKVKEIIVFGSYAWGTPGKDSDLDLLVVLDQKGFIKSFTEKIQRRIKVRASLKDLEDKFPIDLLVYTVDEWEKILETNASFYRNINFKGHHLV